MHDPDRFIDDIADGSLTGQEEWNQLWHEVESGYDPVESDPFDNPYDHNPDK